MSHPVSMAYNARLRYQDLLREAETERLYGQLKANQAKLQPQLKFKLGQILMVAGQKLTGQLHSERKLKGA